jgi:signal transduction histidine kinase
LNLINYNSLDDDLMIYNDFDRINRVLINLIINGIKFTKFGKIDVIIHTRPANSLFYELEVIDTGDGMTKEV